MSEWWTYSLSDFLMFSPAVYARMVERYHRELWPLPWVLLGVGLGLIALAATRAYRDAGWAWLKAVLGVSVFAATLLVVGAAGQQAQLAAAATAADVATLQGLLRSERITLWLLIALCVVNVVLAVFRPKLTITVR